MQKASQVVALALREWRKCLEGLLDVLLETGRTKLAPEIVQRLSVVGSQSRRDADLTA